MMIILLDLFLCLSNFSAGPQSKDILNETQVICVSHHFRSCLP